MKSRQRHTQYTCAFISLLATINFCHGGEAVATAEPLHRADLSFPEAGIVREILVKEGGEIAKDQILARLDTRSLEASLKIAKIKAESSASVQSAEANHSLAKRRFEELQRLAKLRSANPEEVQRASAAYEVSKAELQAAKEEIEASRIQVDRIIADIERQTIRSPIDGLVSRVLVDPGEGVSGTQHVVITVVNLSQLRLSLIHI